MRCNLNSVLALVILISFLACTPPPIVLDEPASTESFLIIGSAVVEDDYFTEFTGVHLAEVEVALLAEIEENGVTRTKGFWTKTDENGYFYLLNMPPGNYALAAIRVFLNDQTWLVISNPLTSVNDEFTVSDQDYVGFIGNYFDIIPHGRVINLKNNYFSVDEQNRTYREVKYIRRETIQGLRLVDGIHLDLVSPKRYFRTKFAGSGWVEIIKRSDR